MNAKKADCILERMRAIPGVYYIELLNLAGVRFGCLLYISEKKNCYWKQG